MIEGLNKAFQEVKETPASKNDIAPSFVKDMPEPKLTLQDADRIADTSVVEFQSIDDNSSIEKSDVKIDNIHNESNPFNKAEDYDHLENSSESRSSETSNDGLSTSEISQLWKNYLSDLKKVSPCPDTIDENTDCSDIEKRTPEETKELRSRFNSMRNKLIKEWEKLNDQEWPKYQEDVYDKNGNIVRKAGDYMEAHHIKPLSLGGENTAENITPMHYDDHNDHRGIHSSDSSYSRLENKAKENAE